jgi:DNA replication protein DnaD
LQPLQKNSCVRAPQLYITACTKHTRKVVVLLRISCLHFQALFDKMKKLLLWLLWQPLAQSLNRA